MEFAKMNRRAINALEKEDLINLLKSSDSRTKIRIMVQLERDNVNLIKELHLDEDENKRVRKWAKYLVSPGRSDSGWSSGIWLAIAMLG